MTGAFRLGLTGSVGMGKSTTAAMFRAAGVPVWDADACVHRLYAPGGAAVAPVGAAFPAALVDGAIDRARLREALLGDAAAFARLESIVHPLVAADRAGFLRRADAEGQDIVLLDIPLLYETGAESDLDGVAVVSVDRQTQAARVLARPGMTEDALQAILARQMRDAEKRKRADWVIDTTTLEGARAQVAAILSQIRQGRAGRGA
ncbi:MAG: dephospho-CoA kinase [Pseudomonadota bacterium]